MTVISIGIGVFWFYLTKIAFFLNLWILYSEIPLGYMGMKSECLVFSSGLSFIEFVPQNCQCRVRVELQPAFADREEWLFVPMRTCCATDSLGILLGIFVADFPRCVAAPVVDEQNLVIPWDLLLQQTVATHPQLILNIVDRDDDCNEHESANSGLILQM